MDTSGGTDDIFEEAVETLGGGAAGGGVGGAPSLVLGWRLQSHRPWLAWCFISLLTGLRPDSLHAALVSFTATGDLLVRTHRMKNKNAPLGNGNFIL
eukprot:COSAG02_NODE_18606_length_929_cov_3.677108_1_plen_97_part_00